MQLRYLKQLISKIIYAVKNKSSMKAVLFGSYFNENKEALKTTGR